MKLSVNKNVYVKVTFLRKTKSRGYQIWRYIDYIVKKRMVFTPIILHLNLKEIDKKSIKTWQ